MKFFLKYKPFTLTIYQLGYKMRYPVTWSIIWVCLWQYSWIWMISTFQFVNWVGQIALPNIVALTQSGEDLNKINGWPATRKRPLFLPASVELEKSFPALRLTQKHALLLGLESASFQIRTYTTDFYDSVLDTVELYQLLFWVSHVPCAYTRTFQPP